MNFCCEREFNFYSDNRFLRSIYFNLYVWSVYIENTVRQLQAFTMAGYSSYHSTGNSVAEADFQRLTQVVISNIQKISQNVRSMEMMVNQLGTAQDTDTLRAGLHNIQHYTNQLARDTNCYLRQIQAIPVPHSPSEQRQWKMQRERLAGEFSTALVAFQNSQKLTAQKEKEIVAKTKSDSGMMKMKYMHDDNAKRSGGEQLIALESPVQNQMAMQLEDEANLELLLEREQAIHQIENDIVEVNQIFKDLAIMVHDQGTMIDSIEANIEQTSIHVDHGAEQLRAASRYQAASRRKLCIIVLIAVVVLAVVITIIVLSVKV